MYIHEIAQFDVYPALRHDFVSIGQERTTDQMKKHKSREENMPSTIKSDAERARKQYASIVTHYRAIGPAAIAAAVLCMRKPIKKPAWSTPLGCGKPAPVGR